jgi:predicted DNA-binding ribbon-helix-helix protein
MSGYETDFYLWTQEQVTLLREGRLDELDVPNLVEEIDSLGRSQRHELRSRLRVLLLHLLKWHHQPERQGPSWESTISEQRIHIDELLSDSPSLRPQVPIILPHAYALARRSAHRETRVPLSTFPETCPYTVEQVLDDAFWPA